MNTLKEIKAERFILALFIRDDGERFLLGSGAYEFKESQMHFATNTLANDVVEVQGNDGVLLAGQVRRASTQVFEGYVGDGVTSEAKTEDLRREFLKFFRKDYFYNVVYIFHDGSAIQRRRGFLVDAPEVREFYQIHPEYHVGLDFEDVNYYSYNEDDEGNEIYGKSLTLRLGRGVVLGGLIWDEVGVVWDEKGATWSETDGGGPVVVFIDSIDNVYPIWEVVGPAVNPTLTDSTTGKSFKYTGSVTGGQKLVIDMNDQTALLNGTNVISNVTADWLSFAPGDNRLDYTADNNDAPASTLRWQEIVG